MVQILPEHISSDDVDSLQRELTAGVPYTDDQWNTASIDFQTLNITINIRLASNSYSAETRERISRVIQLLPQFHANVLKTFQTVASRDEQHQLSWIDIDFDPNDVNLCYDAVSFNAQWSQTFRLDGQETPNV